MTIYKYLAPIYKGYEVILKPEDYFSKRYGKRVALEVGEIFDGATFEYDIDSWSWPIHDKLKITRQWKDGTHCSNFKASVVVFDILVSENRFIRAPLWFTGTLVWGYTKQLLKGLGL